VSHHGQVSVVLPYVDQALLLALRGAGQEAVSQAVWFYERPVDLEGLRRFHQMLGRGMLNRRVERSPLPFGRHRWVAESRPESELEVAEQPLPRDRFPAWADDQVDLPLDPERGPSWRMAVQPFDDGGMGVSLVASHCVADGSAMILVIVQAVLGMTHDLGYPPPRSVRWRSAAMRDLRQFVSDVPDVARAVGSATRQAFAKRHELRGQPALPSSSATGTVPLPTVSVFIDAADWQARAEALGGSTLPLVAALAARLGADLGRDHDGSVLLLVPVSQRADASDTGANAVTLARVRVDANALTEGLAATRVALRQALASARQEPDEAIELLPLIPFVPRRAVGALSDAAFGFTADLPVSCSSFGEAPVELLRVDGTPALRMYFRGVDRKVSLASLERRGGVLSLFSATIGETLVLSIVGFQPQSGDGTVTLTTREHLLALVTQALTDLDVTATLI